MDTHKKSNLTKIDVVESVSFLLIFFLIFGYIGNKMGPINMIKTILNTSYSLLMDICFYLMAICVITGGIGALFMEFKVIKCLNSFLSLLMNPFYSLPGASAWGVLTCYISDNPAMLSLAENEEYKSYFKKYQFPALTNLGTSFGMGLIVTATIMSLPMKGAILAAIIGNLGAIIGSIVSVRLMLGFTKKYYGPDAYKNAAEEKSSFNNSFNNNCNKENIFSRFINSLIKGGASGVELGFQIIPGVLLICSFVLLISNTAPAGGVYDGSAGQGVPILPYIGEKLSFIIQPLFGFKSPESIAVPITSLGSAGAAIGLIPDLMKKGLISAQDLAVFTSISMCWSGYLSTHIAMMSAIGESDLSGKAIISHTIGGLVAGLASHLIFKLIMFVI
ncbi:CD0519/CD1768 family membrane protein [Peptoniphilus catoniae]|uniref:CD0519/CD1768 family membrane protein n=1 Tax=Peptoniphilus catoniae TaxID=1660341 RepID=UPI0010FED4C3|nr:hypothetical protein [Peptoniphilus catoniae]